jgi:hypothetical protein
LNAAKKIILLLWLVLVASLGNVSASTPGAGENRVWQKSFETLETRQAEPLQTLGGHQENGVAGYDYAVDSLLAAETTATQLEFPFARGASIQTPGVTTAGESFVRVGAGPQNLKFGSTSLSGAQPGTYAFPEGTFNAIGQDPALLKNLGDLPGAPPQYFRILQPPAGTPIQRGIVPGGQFGGVGGAQEVIFPKGF